MPSRKTLVQENTDSVSSKPEEKTSTKTRKPRYKIITRDHINQALTYYLRSLRMIETDEEVTYLEDYSLTEFEIKVEKFND